MRQIKSTDILQITEIEGRKAYVMVDAELILDSEVEVIEASGNANEDVKAYWNDKQAEWYDNYGRKLKE